MLPSLTLFFFDKLKNENRNEENNKNEEKK